MLYREVQDVKELPARGQAGTSRRSSQKRILSRVVAEELQAGAHRIVITPGRDIWQVDRHKAAVPPGGSIAIDHLGNVRTS